MPHQVLPGRRLQLRLDLGPYVIMATDQKTVATTALEVLLNLIGHGLEVLHGFVHQLALGVSGVITTPAVALAAPGQAIEEILLLHDVVVHDLKDARLGSVGQHHAGMLDTIEGGGERFQMEALVEHGWFWATAREVRTRAR